MCIRDSGFDTGLSQGGVNVSGGQKQRLCIARAMLRKPAVLILDDSTSAVDSATEAAIRESFAANLKETTVIIIAQRISSVPVSYTHLDKMDSSRENRGKEEGSILLEKDFNEVYTKFKLHFYRAVFGRFKRREATLTTVETFCMEIILALGEPTVNEFSNFVGISPPNAAYKINSLVQKGYVEKRQSQEDKREYHLVATQKYLDYYNISYHYLNTVMSLSLIHI